MYLWKSNSRSHKLDVQETNFSLTVPLNLKFFSLTAGLRMEGIPAIDLSDLSVEVLHSFLNQPSKQGNLCRDE